MGRTMMAKAKLTREKLLVNLVSEEMGASTDTVEKVLGLMEKLEVYAASIYVEEGEAHVGWMDGIQPGDDEPEAPEVPQSLSDRLRAVEFDLVQLVEPIKAAWPKVYGLPYPITFAMRHDAKDPMGP